ncbi:carbon-nitrogen hydrolase family protein [Agaribacter flavus]|uniref:Carbon-nitrogen hydrolase family protein n=1 Tax=Agaribacter flavus TaxID=1902781 RepID=A0ABV7FUW0_9ALTE
MVSLHALQMNSSDCLQDNLQKVETLISRIPFNQYATDHHLIVLPECFSLFGCGGTKMLAHAEKPGNGMVQGRLSILAQETRSFIVAGSSPMLSAQHDKYYASSIVYSPDGKQLATYNKMHLFDVEVNDGTHIYRESDFTMHGETVSVVNLAFGRIGQSICYDLRFPELYRAMDFPEIIVVPSAFTKVTGQAHWHALLSARAIENQCYVVAANQYGSHADKRETFGHSCIYSPWGELLSIIKSGEGVASSVLNIHELTKIRQAMPVRSHIRGKYE